MEVLVESLQVSKNTYFAVDFSNGADTNSWAFEKIGSRWLNVATTAK